MFNIISALLGDHWHSSSSLAAAKTERTTATVVQWSLKPIIQTILFSSTRKLAWKSCGCRSVSRNQVANNQLKPCHTDYPTCEKKEENRTLTFSIQVQTPQKEWKKNRIAKSETFLCPPWRCLQASQDQRQDGESSPQSQNNTPGGSWKSLYYPTLSTSPKVPASRRSRARSSGCGPARVV